MNDAGGRERERGHVAVVIVTKRELPNGRSPFLASAQRAAQLQSIGEVSFARGIFRIFSGAVIYSRGKHEAGREGEREKEKSIIYLALWEKVPSSETNLRYYTVNYNRN